MHLRDKLGHLLEIWAMHNGANWQDDGAKMDTMGLGKSLNGANLHVFLLEINGANIILYFTFVFKQKRAIFLIFLLCYIQLRSDKVK